VPYFCVSFELIIILDKQSDDDVTWGLNQLDAELHGFIVTDLDMFPQHIVPHYLAAHTQEQSL